MEPNQQRAFNFFFQTDLTRMAQVCRRASRSSHNTTLAVGAGLAPALLAKFTQHHTPISGYVLFIGYACVFMPFWLNGLHYYHNAKMLPVWYFPGFFGMIIGAVIISSKTTLPDGRRISTFDNSTVRQGIAILGMNILAWIINALLLAFVVF